VDEDNDGRFPDESPVEVRYSNFKGYDLPSPDHRGLR
jgi:hypothetical protein